MTEAKKQLTISLTDKEWDYLLGIRRDWKALAEELAKALEDYSGMVGRTCMNSTTQYSIADEALEKYRAATEKQND